MPVCSSETDISLSAHSRWICFPGRVILKRFAFLPGFNFRAHRLSLERRFSLSMKSGHDRSKKSDRGPVFFLFISAFYIPKTTRPLQSGCRFSDISSIHRRVDIIGIIDDEEPVHPYAQKDHPLIRPMNSKKARKPCVRSVRCSLKVSSCHFRITKLRASQILRTPLQIFPTGFVWVFLS